MPSFQDYYRSIFAAFGSPLTERDALRAAAIERAEARLGVRLPAALREYYLVAGGEQRFNTCFQRLLPPDECFLDQRRLVFMEENQSVVWWGVSTRSRAADPPVDQGIDSDPFEWYREHRKCSVFLAIMLHDQAVSGGLPHCGHADAPERSDYRFEEHGWTFFGEVNSLLAYSRPNQVVCLTPPDNVPFKQRWTVAAGGKTKADLQAIAAEVGVALRS